MVYGSPVTVRRDPPVGPRVEATPHRVTLVDTKTKLLFAGSALGLVAFVQVVRHVWALSQRVPQAAMTANKAVLVEWAVWVAALGSTFLVLAWVLTQLRAVSADQ
ncbi:hypothetical protein [Haloarchaeobius sp. TZWSO28]|uniref:hypothetical protein n=1 Tax=Haloarchaeobius sp. TZWSO28 TaxID=3446119 RepID=UPI003EC05CC3